MATSTINFRRTDFSTANFVRLVRREIDRCSVYATVDGQYWGRLYRVNLERGELQFDFSHTILRVAANAVIELSDGITQIAF